MPIPGNFLSSVTEMVDPNTSGWTPLLNCTTTLGTGGRNGDGCLTVKSVAAGETRARTVSSYPVLAGTMYQTFADASSPTVAERIGIRWLDALNAEISITWSLSTAAVSTSWHRIGVASVAPMGAVRAQVVLAGMTPAAANVINFFENVYLGLPIRTTGNLLDFNTETMEVDASGWAVESNCTLARTVPVVQWPVGYYHGGGQMLALTVTATGNASAKTTAVTCTAGEEYVFFGHISPPASGAKYYLELRFLDGSGTQLKATRSTLDAPSTGTFRQIGSDIAPAGTASAVLAVGITSGTAAQVVRFDNCVVSVLSQTLDGQTIPAMLSGTVVPYADAGFEQGVAGWTKTSGPATIARSSPWGVQAVSNAYSMAVSSATVATSVITSAVFPLGPDADTKSWSNIFSVTGAGTGAWKVGCGFVWYDASGAMIHTETSDLDSLPATGWWVLTTVGTIPAGAVSAAVQILAQSTVTSSVLYVDSVSLLPTLPNIEFDAFAETGSVRLTIRNQTPGRLVSLWRIAADGTRTLVRGPAGLYDGVPLVSDVMIVEDYEAPLGVPVTYYQELYYATTGAFAGNATLGPVTIPFPDGNYAWLKDPGNPQRNVKVMIAQPAPDWQRPIDQATYVVQGRRNKVIRSGLRQGLEGDLAVFTQSDTERLNLHWLLDSGNTLLWQAAPGYGVTDMYINVGQITETRPPGRATDPWRTWTLPLIEADMPTTVGVNGSAGRTWQDILTEFATWQDVRDAFATWEDVFLNRRKAA